MPLMLHAQTPVVVGAARWYLLLVPLYASVGMLSHPLRGRGDFAPWNAMRLCPNALWIVVLTLAWACSQNTPVFVAKVNLVAVALLLFPFAAIVRMRVPGPFRPDLYKVPSMLRYGLPCMMTGLPQMLNLRLDQMLMTALLPPRELGLYVVAVSWSGAAGPVLNAVGVVMTPAVASAADSNQGALRLVRGSRLTVTLAVILSLVFAAVTPIAMLFLFGRRFTAAIPAALILVPAGGVLGVNLVLQEGLRGAGRPFAVLGAEIAGLAVTALALGLMLRPMGIMGAAIASLAGYVTVNAVLLLNTKRHFGIPLSQILLPRPGELREVFGRLISAAGNVA
jgi:O-antigen/teichoic acid export membrane protein